MGILKKCKFTTLFCLMFLNIPAQLQCSWNSKALADTKRKEEVLSKILQTKSGYTIQKIEDVKDLQTLKDIPFAPATKNEARANGKGFVLFQDVLPVGYVSYKKHVEEKETEISRLGIRKSHQGQGLGAFLMKYIMRLIANEESYTKVTLKAVVPDSKREDLYRFYYSLGFESPYQGTFVFENRILGISADEYFTKV